MAVYNSPIISNKAKPRIKGKAVATTRIGTSSNPNHSKTAIRSPIDTTLARSKYRVAARRVFNSEVPPSTTTTTASERVFLARSRVDNGDEDDEMNASSGDDDDDMDEDWTEGKTLVDNLKHFGIDNSDDALEELLACADELQGPMSAKSKELQQDLIDTLVPAMDHIRIVHGLLENTVESKYTEAVLDIDKAADEYQEKAVQCRAELVKMLEESKKVVGRQFTILQNEYANRSKLYDDFLAKVKDIGAATLQTLDEQAKEDVEHLKTELEKKSKVFAKIDKGGKSQDMLLKSLMGGSGRK
ncbi:hypothetical protein FRC04_011663 [Tulasnella sp. 424]|nr:hypothetical protein FRC04_011663 [Tulasnella sp. 424]KAG8971481.1 hypothetical protein FRC05_011054 [Tulasnella sp. 425]